MHPFGVASAGHYPLVHQKENFMHGIARIAAVTLAALATSISMAAAKEGSYKSDGCFHGQHFMNVLSKDAMGGSYTGITSQAATGEGDFWRNTVGRCNGAWTLVSGELNEYGTCEYSDPSGDKFLGVYTRKNQDGTWKVLGGTGKYEGMESTGTWTPYTQFPAISGEVSSCFHQAGRFKLK
jgi:hypothetical protein